MSKQRARSNGEGSIYARTAGGYAAYAWVTTPTGKRTRKYVYGKTREEVHSKWLALHQQARQGAVSTTVPSLAEYLAAWLAEVIKPTAAPATVANYGMFVRLYIAPALGPKRLDKLTVRDVQTWLNRLRSTCQCCAQGKDLARATPRCCAKGLCCEQVASDWTVRSAWTVLRSALGNAVRDELVHRNVAELARLPMPRPKRVRPWTVDEVRQFLEAAHAAHDPLYAAYVLILTLGLRRGEVLGLKWEDVDLGAGELRIGWQLQRVGGRLLRRETKTGASDAVLPLPIICVAALNEWAASQTRWQREAGEAWQPLGFVFTTRHGLPVEPRNFHRDFKRRSRRAGVSEIPVHATRKTCASLLVALDVHPRVAMQILRHSQIAVTMNVYSEVSSDTTKAALRLLGESLTSGPSVSRDA
ncbi:site-specific integrase [Kineosporia sp. A_224]|uniref:tyrosine-type recombinase/integrase n=1 Tax=Kineosporia sp. A_224 TaxID=1962180 RepID=UPI000B4BB384|nr:site-specific integrase [Kineosporia sp. A_224]